ncbi:MAG TPA: phosphotransferase, partial [Actinomycetota bacterium]|nr:phosphotransferase [Actinomycetota bacterium]
MARHGPATPQIRSFLSDLHGEPVTGLEPLSGGFWSSAYGYRVGDRELVLRLSETREWFEVDRAAAAYDSTDLPVPLVLEIGDAFGGAYAISVRHHGRVLETVDPSEADVVGPTIVRLLAALKRVPPGQETSSWRGWLLAGLVDDPGRAVRGWRPKLAADPEIDALFRACEATVNELASSCPERRDLVHGDLLHSNVLVSEDASRVTGVFSWKCSTRGDFLYDTAWCTFWGAYHPGIGAADVLHRVMADPAFADGLDGAAERHHCYELHIGAHH